MTQPKKPDWADEKVERWCNTIFHTIFTKIFKKELAKLLRETRTQAIDEAAELCAKEHGYYIPEAVRALKEKEPA